MAILELQNIHYTYQNPYQKVEALKGISHSFDTGLVYAIAGSSGSGKTTLLSLMAGLDLPTSGTILCDRVSTAQMKLEQYRRHDPLRRLLRFCLFRSDAYVPRRHRVDK